MGRGCELGVWWNDAHCLLAGQRFFPHFVPAHVELAFELCNPIFGRVVRCVRRSWSVIGHPGLIGRDCVQHLNAGDGVIRHILVKEIVWLIVWRLYRLDVLVERGRPLAGVAAQETIEIFEAQTRGP